MKVLITRPIDEAIALANTLDSLGYITVIEPLMEIEVLEIPNLNQLSKYEAIVISSKNSIKAIKNADKKLTLVIVGEESTKFAQSLGFENSIYGGANISELKKTLEKYQSLLYLTGTDITDDLSSIKAKVTRQIVYRTKPVGNVSINFLSFIKDPLPKIILFFSTANSEVFKNFINDHELNTYCCNIIALTLSPKIAHNLSDMNFKKCYIAKEPNISSMINSINVIQNGC